MSSILAAVSLRWRRFGWRAAGVALVLSLGVGGAGATTTWTGGADDGKWTTAGNWSAGVPTGPNQAVFGGLGTSNTIGSITAANFSGAVFNSGSYSFTLLSFSGSLTINGGAQQFTTAVGFNSGAVTITVASGASLTLASGIARLAVTAEFKGAGDYYLKSIGTASGTFSKTGTGKLTLTGTSFAAPTVFSAGTLILGANPARITFSSNVTLGADVTTQFQLNGTGRGTTYDALDIAASSGPTVVTYGGTLALDFGSTFADGDVLDLFKYGTSTSANASSSFASVEASGLYSGTFTAVDSNTWTLVKGGHLFTFNETTGDLTVAAAPVPVPEPATCAVIVAGGALGLALWRRRAKRA
ncbi:MAG: hypothetical protein JSS11_06895 [Verrucomicrobia bacterium]|nr:hypothetical protein [Verrucomicrobiota bacterium]